MQNNSGIKGQSVARAMDRNISRELNRAAPNSLEVQGDICAPVVKEQPFSKGCDKRMRREETGGPQMYGKAQISSDSRTQDLISDKNPRLDHHGDRMDEHGGIKDTGNFKTDMTKGRQGNTVAQPSDGKSKYNRDNQVMNNNDSI